MTSPEMKKAPAATGAIKNRKTIHHQEEGFTMPTSLPRTPAHFDTTINVAGVKVSADRWEHGELIVSLDFGDGPEQFKPEAACALAAAISAVAVHQMEQAQAVAA